MRGGEDEGSSEENAQYIGIFGNRFVGTCDHAASCSSRLRGHSVRTLEDVGVKKGCRACDCGRNDRGYV